MPPRNPYVTLITRPPDLAALVARLRQEPAVAVDVEADSFHSYFEKTCLIQFSVPGLDAIVDPLALPDLSPLGTVFADPASEKVFHAAEYDIICLKRDYGFLCAPIFDTMVAAKALGWPRVGLASLLAERFGVQVDKRLQRADWSRRPLSPEQIAYAAQDTHYLLALRDILRQELIAKGRLAAAQEEFARLTNAEWNKRSFDPEDYRRLGGARELDPVGHGVLRELYVYRDAQARALDRPPFRVLSERLLLALSRTRPQDEAALERVPGMTPYLLGRHRRGLLAAIARGQQQPQPWRTPPGRHQRLNEEERERLARLREWRQATAAAQGVEPEVIIPRQALFALARQAPQSLADLAGISDLGSWRAQEYGAAILAALWNRKP
ncbi:MAG: ribonuclease D [Chloroflexi bacterium]|nr:ribonuclease D [Chloroflexota bacterium]